MLFVIDKTRFKKFVCIVREDKKRTVQGNNSPYLKIRAEKDEVEVSSSTASALIKTTVYEPGVLFIRTTLFRNALRAAPANEPYITFQADKEALVFADVRVPFETNDMVLYTNPAEAPMSYPPPVPASELIEEKSFQPTLFELEKPVDDEEDLAAKLKVFRFKEGNLCGSWTGIIDGIHFSICLYPLKGIAISYYYIKSRTAVHNVEFIPKESTVQEIAKALVKIHNKLIPEQTG